MKIFAANCDNKLPEKDLKELVSPRRCSFGNPSLGYRVYESRKRIKMQMNDK